MVQGMQTVLYSHIRQLQSPHQFSDFGSNLKDCTCRGYRDDRVGSRIRQKIISYEVRKQRFTRRAHGLGFSQPHRSTCRSGNLHSIGGGPVYCLKTSEVDTAEEKSVNSPGEGKNVDAAGTEDWAVKKGLSALDAYFDKLHASRVEEQEPPSVTAHSQGTATRVSTTVPPSSTGRTGSVTGSQSFSQEADIGNVAKDHVESHEKRNIGGLNALDSYFNKLRPSEPGKGK